MCIRDRGYYVPGMDAKPLEGNTLILAHQTLYSPNVSDKKLLDDCMYCLLYTSCGRYGPPGCPSPT